MQDGSCGLRISESMVTISLTAICGGLGKNDKRKQMVLAEQRISMDGLSVQTVTGDGIAYSQD
jgi:hypothetical protein